MPEQLEKNIQEMWNNISKTSTFCLVLKKEDMLGEYPDGIIYEAIRVEDFHYTPSKDAQEKGKPQKAFDSKRFIVGADGILFSFLDGSKDTYRKFQFLKEKKIRFQLHTKNVARGKGKKRIIWNFVPNFDEIE